MVDEAIWRIEDHTRAKHELLRRYLGAWFPILASSGFNARVLFLDGFAGPGVYAGGEPGSPVIALRTLVNHPHFARLRRTEFVFIFVENDPERFASLETEVERFWESVPGGCPDNVKVHPHQSSFQELAEELVAQYSGDAK